MRRALLATVVLGSSACVGSSTVNDPDGAAAVHDFAGVTLDLRGSQADLAMSLGDLATVYPPGPYGNNIGDVIPPLVWEGYRDDLADALATTKPYGPYSMDDLRRSGRAYGMVHVSGFG